VAEVVAAAPLVVASSKVEDGHIWNPKQSKSDLISKSELSSLGKKRMLLLFQ
jgi:hypothetical protein